MSYGMRLYYLIRKVPGPSEETRQTGVVAEACVFSDGIAILHWLTDPQGTEFYASEADMRRIREASGRSGFSRAYSLPAPGNSGRPEDPSACPRGPEGRACVIQPPHRELHRDYLGNEWGRRDMLPLALCSCHGATMSLVCGTCCTDEEPPLPLQDDDSEAAADAAEQRARFCGPVFPLGEAWP